MSDWHALDFVALGWALGVLLMIPLAWWAER